ncbi:MAG: beta-ketoacyl synthase N-terminal-like domain-containing protein [Nakamurella sp.]
MTSLLHHLDEERPESPSSDVGAPEISATDIAVIGMAGRYPGSPDLDSLWDNVIARRDVIRDLDDTALRALAVPASLLSRSDLVRAGGQLEDVDCFDADQFGIDLDELALMDPQHRVFLEIVESALQNAGLGVRDPASVVGVFAAAGPNRHHHEALLPQLQRIDASWDTLLPTGIGADHMVSRVAYKLGLDGPAMAVAATCAGSLAAVCTAATALIDLQCDVAVAGGVHLTSPRYLRRGPGTTSADGRCRALSADADGAGMSSGAGVVVLKRHQDAVDDGDPVLAVIRGYAMTNDGAARAGFAAPGIAGQQAAVDQAQAAAQVGPAEIGAVFCHALGTPLGDAIEVGALRRVWASAARPARTALVAPKTHLGNLDVASGIAALHLAILAARAGTVPGNLHFSTPGALLELDGSGLTAQAGDAAWPSDRRRLAGVSSFGVGGTNVHLVIEASAQPADEESAAVLDEPLPLLLSTRTAADLRLFAGRLAEHLERHRPALTAVSDTLLTGRRVHACTHVVWSRSVDEAVTQLQAVANDPAPALDHALPTPLQSAGTMRVPLPAHPFRRIRIPGPASVLQPLIDAGGAA